MVVDPTDGWMSTMPSWVWIPDSAYAHVMVSYYLHSTNTVSCWECMGSTVVEYCSDHTSLACMGHAVAEDDVGEQEVTTSE